MPGTTPVYGFPYPEPTDLVADYPALGQDLAEDIEAVLPTISGLALISPTSIANSGGTATSTNGTVAFSAVTSISLNGCFTAAADNYLVMIQVTASSAAAYTAMRMRAAGTDATAANYATQVLEASSTSVTGSRVTSQTSWNVLYHDNSYPGTFAQMTMNAPALARNTNAVAFLPYRETAAANIAWRTHASVHLVTTAYDGFTLLPASGTITGNVRVYSLKGA